MSESISIELIAIVGLLITQVGQTIARIFTISKKDKQQDKRITTLENQQEVEQKALKYIYDKTKENEYREQIKVKIRQIADKTIFANSLSNTDFVAFVNQTRDTYINFIDSILVQDIHQLRIETIESDMVTFAKNLKNLSRSETICKNKNFYEKLKNDIIKPQINIFLLRFKADILEEKQQFNGDFDKIAVGTIELLIVEIIKLYRECSG